MDRTSILIVEDTEDVRIVIAIYLRSQGYTVLEAENAQRAIELLQDKNNNIEIVLSDIMMPGMDGYELCKKIKSDPALNSIPVLFISQLSSLEEKLKGYAVGGEDYIVKPVDLTELGVKISTLLEFRSRVKAINQELKNTQQTTQQVMRYYSDIGQILEFFTQSQKTKTFEDLAQTLFDTTNSWNLNCVIQFHAGDRIINFGSTGPVSPLEANVIELARAQTRFFDFGKRTIINYTTFSLLVRNMPVDDKERYGTLKDSLGTLCNAVEARAYILISDELANKKHVIVEDVHSAIGDVRRLVTKLHQTSINAADQMVEKMEDLFLRLGLSEQQEEAIRKIVDENNETVEKAMSESDQVTKHFAEISEQLTDVLNMRIGNKASG